MTSIFEWLDSKSAEILGEKLCVRRKRRVNLTMVRLGVYVDASHLYVTKDSTSKENSHFIGRALGTICIVLIAGLVTTKRRRMCVISVSMSMSK